MSLRVERGKGGQYRNAMLSTDLLTLLCHWWKLGREQGVMHRWLLFPGQHDMKLISTKQFHRVVSEAAQAAGIARQGQPTHAAPQLRERTACGPRVRASGTSVRLRRPDPSR